MPADRVPAGNWPQGFPAYATAADIVTNGSMASLRSALDRLPNGGVVEHPGNISGDVRRASGTGGVVVRPPLGRRNDFRLEAVDIRSSGILLAGFRQTSKVHVHDSVRSGLAWTEMDPGTEVRGFGYSRDTTTHVLLYEVVARNPKPAGGDRVVAHAQQPGAITNVDIVGSWLTGSHNSPDGDHADTVQTVYLSGGTGFINIQDSVIWPSDDKALQGAAEVPVYAIRNTWIASASAARKVWPSLDVTGYHAITAVTTIDDSVLSGTVHRSFPVSVSNSTVADNGGTLVDRGGNTYVGSVPAPPAAPSHAALDGIWHS